jgi:hypothetical protein
LFAGRPSRHQRSERAPAGGGESVMIKRTDLQSGQAGLP